SGEPWTGAENCTARAAEPALFPAHRHRPGFGRGGAHAEEEALPRPREAAVASAFPTAWSSACTLAAREAPSRARPRLQTSSVAPMQSPSPTPMTTRATGVRAAAAGTPATTHDGLDAYEAFRARRHMPSLDGIRCLAIVAVLWHHSPHADSVPVTRGFLGVDLFFVLSGFLITTLLLREQDAAGGRIDLRAFYVRRILRIFPLYYAVLFGQAVALLLFRPHSPVADEFFAALPWYATYTANFGVHANLFAHAWSLAVEEQFYLLWPPVLAWCTRRGARALLVAYLLVTAALDWGLAGAGAQQVALYMTPFAAIGCGVLLAFGLHDRATFGRIAPIVGWRGFVFLPLVALAALVCVPGDLAGWPRAAIYVAMTALIAAVVV